ncbi:NUDIX hydrolase, partial [Mammaliicoccus sciuri]
MINNLRSMTSIYIINNDEILLLYRKGSRVLNDLWIGSAGGHFNDNELDKPYE